MIGTTTNLSWGEFTARTPIYKLDVKLFKPDFLYSCRVVVPTCGTHTPGGMQQTSWGYAKIILVMAENTKK
jgi:hypothetical protein